MQKLFISFVLLLLFTLSAQADRVALLIANNAYNDNNELYNPINDIRLLKKTLLFSGFSVQILEDGSLSEMQNALDKFQKSLDVNSVGFFYFAGHGVEIKGTNYLVPIDAKFDSEDKLKRTSLNVSQVVRRFKEVGNTLNIMVLDACRNNPVSSMSGSGLAPFISPEGLFVAYSAQSGARAQDGPKGGNSPFALALAKNMSKNLDLENLFRETRIEVYNKTDGKQRPSTYSEVLSRFSFAPEDKKRGLKLNKSASHSVDFIRHKRFIEPPLALIKAGSFMQGSEDDFEASPQHEVRIEKDFFVGIYEVSFEEYDMFTKHTGWKRADDNGWGRGKQPVINVSNEDAEAYVRWLSKMSHKKYRLISESEWEYVARAGSKSNYGFGDDDGLLDRYAWYKSNANSHPHRVGMKKNNAFGVYDILGNVAELTSTSFYKYSMMPDNSISKKVVRGGAYFSAYDELEVYKRSERDESMNDKYTGFRVVLEK